MVKILLYVVFIIAGGFMIFYEIRQHVKCTEETIGTIVGVRRRSHRSRGRRTTSYYPVFQYLVNGQTVESEADINSIFRGKYKEGTTMTVRYDPSDPQKFVVKGKFLTSMVLGGALLLLLGVFALIAALK